VINLKPFLIFFLSDRAAVGWAAVARAAPHLRPAGAAAGRPQDPGVAAAQGYCRSGARRQEPVGAADLALQQQVPTTATNSVGDPCYFGGADPDPCLLLMDQDPDPFSDFKDAENLIFFYIFFLCTLQGQHLQS
jgi:hypothetical protein